MVIAVTIMSVMQMAADKIVNMVAVRYAFVPTGRTVRMVSIVGFAIMIRRARVRIGLTHRHGMLIDMSIVDVVHVPVVKIIGMAVMHHRLVAALGIMHVTMGSVLFAYGFHGIDTSMLEISKAHATAHR
jgi:hypothetical protein